MLDYIKHSEVFRKLDLFDYYKNGNIDDNDMRHAIRCCF